MPKVSIVTAAYEAGATIADTIASVHSQTWPEVEHIIVDGNSKDATKDIAARLARPGDIFISEADDGLYDAMNKGIARASGDIIGILNADDMYSRPDILEQVVHAFKRYEVDAVLGDIGFFRPSAPDKIFRRYDSSIFNPGRIAWGWMPAHPATFLRRKAYARVGSYRTDYRIAADFEFIARAFGRHGLTYAHIPEILVRMRAGGKSTAGLKSTIIIQQETLRACRENGIYSNALMIASKFPRKLMGYIR